MSIDTQYEDLLRKVLEEGVVKEDRTGTGTISLFGERLRYDLSKGFPLVTTKNVFFRGVAEELFWFLRGEDNVKPLQDKRVRIWDEWRRPLDKRETVVVHSNNKITDSWSEPFSSGDFWENSLQTLENMEDGIEKDLFVTWMNMMQRCYYSDEGTRDSGVKVDPRWHSFENFLEDAPTLPHYWYFEQGEEAMVLDREYYGSNYYGPDSTVWSRKSEVEEYALPPVNVIDEETGDVTVYVNEKNVPESFLNGRYRVEPFDPWGDSLYRLELVEDGGLGPIYGVQWRNWVGEDGSIHDQIEKVMESLKNDPDSRRHIVSAWNVGELDKMALPPCHVLFQFYVADGRLSLQMYQRSSDEFLGKSFNLASYSLLLHMMAQQLDLEVGDFIWIGGDVHIYSNHIKQVKEQLSREPYPFPTLKLRKAKDLYSYTWDDIELVDYQCHPTIKAPIAV